jgi:hypothetical protein
MRTQTTITAAPEPFGGGAFSMFPWRCRAELSNQLLDADGVMIEYLIDFAFTILGVQTLDVRVTSADGTHMLIIVQD